MQNNSDTVWHEQAEHVCAFDAATIVDVGHGDDPADWRFDAVANSSFGVAQIAV